MEFYAYSIDKHLLLIKSHSLGIADIMDHVFRFKNGGATATFKLNQRKLMIDAENVTSVYMI